MSREKEQEFEGAFWFGMTSIIAILAVVFIVLPAATSGQCSRDRYQMNPTLAWDIYVDNVRRIEKEYQEAFGKSRKEAR